MTPLAIFLLGCATVFLGAVQAAFSALMRLSLRLMAERGGKSDRLAHYLDDPLQLLRAATPAPGDLHCGGGRTHRPGQRHSQRDVRRRLCRVADRVRCGL